LGKKTEGRGQRSEIRSQRSEGNSQQIDILSDLDDLNKTTGLTGKLAKQL
jgi:hypothetical protein